MRRRLTLLALLLLAVAGVLAWGHRAELRAWRARSRVPRIVLVSLDTLHVRYAGPYNPEVDNTPVMDRMAAAGVVFERAYTAVPSTLPAHAAMMTGREPSSLGTLVNGHQAPDEAVTLAETLSAAGYRTGAVVSLGVLRSRFGLAQGFDHYEDRLFRQSRRWYLTADQVVAAAVEWLRAVAGEPFFLWVHLSDPHEPYQEKDAPPDARLLLDGRPIGEWNLTSKERHLARIRLEPGGHALTWSSIRTPRPDDLPDTGLAVRFLKTAELEPWLADPTVDLKDEVSLLEPWTIELHNPGEWPVDLFHMFTGRLNQPPESEVLSAYPREVAFMDEAIGELEATLGELGATDDTLWIFISDHGEGLFNHRILGHAVYGQEDHLRIVWMMRGPGVPAGRRVADREALTHDVMPTVLELLGLPVAPDVEGISRVGCWREGCEPRRDWWGFGASADERRITAISGYRWPYKVLWQPEPASGCFRLDEDPWEMHDLCPGGATDGLPREVTGLERDLRTRLIELQRRIEGLDAGADEDDPRELDEILRSLGYVGN